MKRYISSIIIVMVILLSIGIYYVNLVSYASDLPKYTFKTLEGSEKELDSVIIDGGFDNGKFTEDLTIESNQTIYQRERSYLEKRFGNQAFDRQRLVSEYPSFMRGKEYKGPYYEDSDYLAYAWVNSDFTSSGKFSAAVEVAILEKKSKQENSFKIAVPKQEEFGFIEVLDVQLVQSKLQVITLNNVDEKQTQEIYLYTIDIGKEKIVSDEIILSEPFDSNNQGHISLVNNLEYPHSSKRLLFTIVKGSYQEDDSFEENPKESSLFAYHYETKKLEKMEFPKKNNITFETLSDGYYDGENLYIIEGESEGKHVLTFNLSSQTITNDYKLDQSGYEQSSVTIKNGRIYFLTSYGKATNQQSQLLIVDVKTNETLYKGETVLKSADQKKAKNEQLYLHSLQIK